MLLPLGVACGGVWLAEWICVGEAGREPSLDAVPIRFERSGKGKTFGAGADDLCRPCGL